MAKVTRTLTIALVFAILAPLAHGSTPIAVTDPEDLSGARSSRTSCPGGGIVGYGQWAIPACGGFKLDWDISFDSVADAWNYQYSASKIDGTLLTKEVSHWLLEVSRDFEVPRDINICVEGPQEWTAQEGNPQLPVASFYGIKLGEGDSWSFTSPKSPMWGDFYFKDGKAFCGFFFNTVWNAGIGTDPLLCDAPYRSWIPVPDTQTGDNGYIPEPATLSLLGLGILGLGVLKRRRK